MDSAHLSETDKLRAQGVAKSNVGAAYPTNRHSNLKCSRYASPGVERRIRNRYYLPNYTPEGLKPRRSIEEISSSLGVRLHDVKARKFHEQICDENVKTAKKTNVSFSSFHTVYQVSTFKQDKGLAVGPRQDLAATSNRNSESLADCVPSPRLSLGQARTAVGLLLSQKETNKDITYDSQKKANSEQSGFVPPPPTQMLNNVRILPPMTNDERPPSWNGFAPYSPKTSVTSGYRRLNEPHQSVNESFCSSACEESLATKSQDWYNEWYQYEKYRDDQERPSISQVLNESNTSYNSRHALVDKEPSDYGTSHTPKGAKRPGYDFAPLEETPNNENRDDDPFIVNGVNNSWISDISQNTSSQADHQKHSPEEISKIMESQKDPQDPGWSNAAAKEEEKDLVPNELNFESKYESKRLEKENLIAQVVSRLSDNLSLVHDVELMSQQGGPTPRSEMDKVRYKLLHSTMMDYIILSDEF